MTVAARMSVVLVTDTYESIRPVLDRLLLQTVKDELEIVLVAPSRQALGDAPMGLEGFAAVKVVEFGLPLVLGEGRAAGVRAASAPLVFIGETHTYPDPQFAEALTDAHAGPWALVVPGFRNANPDSILSWAGFLSDYSAWSAGLPAGEITFLPIYNAAYRRSVLLEFGDRLGTALSHGDEMLRGLQARGHRAYFEPRAMIEHVNMSLPASFLGERYLAGMLIAMHRSPRWSWLQRLVYTCATPLLPVVYLSRMREGTRAVRKNTHVPFGVFPAMLVGALAKALGEMVGYASGFRAGAEPRMTEYELHKLSYASPDPG
jgi:hypothetical protein